MEEQSAQHKRWLIEEGGIEGPTHLTTLQQPEQQKRIQRLKNKCWPSVEVLDIGCNWGYILNEVNGKCGVDINPQNIDLAMRSFPTKSFLVGDVTKGLPFEDNQYAIVMEADILEHLEWFDDVLMALKEGLRIARWRLLVTLPWRKDNKCAFCFKHKWIPDEVNIGKIITWLMSHCKRLIVESDGNFIYLEVLK